MSSTSGSTDYGALDGQRWHVTDDLAVIGGGEIGGKAHGLALAGRIIKDVCPSGMLSGVRVGIPRLAVIRTDVFEQFMKQNGLYEIALADSPDERIAHAFLQADLPATVVGDLRDLIAHVHTPLAVRSSSLLEDALRHPFAGVYGTKMIPNNQPEVGDRFKKLSEAIKFVWASTFFRDARSYMQAIGRSLDEERMAVIIQEVVGQRFDRRFYPVVSGVIRTHNCYASQPAEPEDGVVNLALGLGKSIVDGDVTWSYCPRYPRHSPPFGSARDLLKQTQTRFWAVSMDPGKYDPISEAECLVRPGLDTAEWDDVLKFTASTYDAASDRMIMGTGTPGPRALTFGRILELGDVPLNDVVSTLADSCKLAVESDVEIEFAMTLDRQHGLPARFGFLQMRPMAVADGSIRVDAAELRDESAIVASETVLGSGQIDTIRDVVYVKPASFHAKHTRDIATEVRDLNQRLASQQRPYLLIGFGRWGSSDPWLGIPVTWSMISGAKVMVEASLPDMNVDPSQGAHFFHNMISFQVKYFTVRHTETYPIAWDWLDRQPAMSETLFLRHVRLNEPLVVRVDGRSRCGVVLRNASGMSRGGS